MSAATSKWRSVASSAATPPERQPRPGRSAQADSWWASWWVSWWGLKHRRTSLVGTATRRRATLPEPKYSLPRALPSMSASQRVRATVASASTPVGSGGRVDTGTARSTPRHHRIRPALTPRSRPARDLTRHRPAVPLSGAAICAPRSHQSPRTPPTRNRPATKDLDRSRRNRFRSSAEGHLCA